MIYANIVLTVRDESRIDEVRGLLWEQGQLSRSEPGCERFEVYHSESNPAVFLLIERWADEASLAAHRKARAYTEIYQPRVLPLVERVPHVSRLVE